MAAPRGFYPAKGKRKMKPQGITFAQKMEELNRNRQQKTHKTAERKAFHSNASAQEK